MSSTSLHHIAKAYVILEMAKLTKCLQKAEMWNNVEYITIGRIGQSSFPIVPVRLFSQNFLRTVLRKILNVMENSRFIALLRYPGTREDIQSLWRIGSTAQNLRER